MTPLQIPITLDLQHIFIYLAALLVAGNVLIRILRKHAAQFVFNAVVLVALLAMLLYMMLYGTTGTVAGLFSFNLFSLYFMTIFTAGMLLVSLVALAYSKSFKDFALMASMALAGMYMVAMANSLITLFVGLELVGIPSIFIVLLSRQSLEAAAKLFIMASISIAVLSFAIVMFYGATNSFAIAQQSQSGMFIALAAVLFIASLSVEASAFPFNVLIPDVYEGSPAYAVAMLGGINKKLGFAALLQVLILIFVDFRSAFEIILLLSIITMFYGNIVALLQKNFKRMLAYSSIGQAGYIMIGIATGTAGGISATLFQIFAHMFIFIGLLAIVAWLEARNKSEVDDMIGMNQESKFMAFAMTVFLLSLIGLPFTTGFVGKFLLFLSAVRANLAWLAVIGILNTVISIYYYAKPIMAAYTGRAGASWVKSNSAVIATVVACLAITITLGIYPQPLISLVNSVGSYLFAI